MCSAGSSRLYLLNSFQSIVIVPFLSILFKRYINILHFNTHSNRGCLTTQAVNKSRRGLHRSDDVYLFRTFSACCWEMRTPRSWSDCMISLESIRPEQKENSTFIPLGKCMPWSRANGPTPIYCLFICVDGCNCTWTLLVETLEDKFQIFLMILQIVNKLFKGQLSIQVLLFVFNSFLQKRKEKNAKSLISEPMHATGITYSTVTINLVRWLVGRILWPWQWPFIISIWLEFCTKASGSQLNGPRFTSFTISVPCQ